MGTFTPHPNILARGVAGVLISVGETPIFGLANHMATAEALLLVLTPYPILTDQAAAMVEIPVTPRDAKRVMLILDGHL